MKAFTRILNPGTVLVGNGRRASLYVRVEWDGKRLSITGVEGPLSSGNALGSCGQCGIDKSLNPADGWSAYMVDGLRSAWNSHHLNDTYAGTQEQEDEIARRMALAAKERPDLCHSDGKMNPRAPTPKTGFYGLCCEWLKEAGLYEVPHPETGEPYRYGTARLRREVPAGVLAFLASLPESKRRPAWC